MDLVVGPMVNLAPKLLHLLKDEYNLHKGVKTQVRSLARELESMHLALCEVAKVPYDQLNPQVKLWASDVREASYDMEDILDTFLVRVDDGCHQPTDNIRGLIKKMRNTFSVRRLKARHGVAGAIEDIKKQVTEMTERRNRFKVDDVVGKSAMTTSIDPRLLMALRTEVSDLVGIDEPKDEIVKMLNLGDDKKMKIISVVGPGGLGKTTLARVVYDKLTMDMDFSCNAFVSVGQNPDLKKVFKDILLDLDKSQYMNNINYIMTLDETQLIKEIQAFLKEKRYFIVIDDVWKAPLWKNIRVALEDNNLGSKIMVTTRRGDVAELGHCTYKMQPLRPDSSKVLFYGRIFGSQGRCPEILSEVSDKILKKCNGVPLAIITVASLLANKSDDITEWQEVCSSIGSGLSSSNDMYNDMRKILLLSYYDLPPDMKTCFLYLSMYPEDHAIHREELIWRWISEGFIQPQKTGDDLFELGKSYFNDLINRSLVQPDVVLFDEIFSCRVHDMILDLICSLSREGNFVTTSNDIEQLMSSESKKLRRLSLKNTATWPKKGVAQLRSIAVFGNFIDSAPSFSCLDMLRVLNLEGCSLTNCGGSKLYVGNLIHLRYLNLRGTGLKVSPAGIEKLQFLQVLLMDPNYLVELPESIFRLRRLMCLHGVRCCPQPGNLLRNLTSLQMLGRLNLLSVGAVEAMGHLTQLTRVEIDIKLEMVDQSFCDALLNSLCNMPRLSYLKLKCKGFYISLAPPPHLCEVEGSSLWMLLKWINIASLPQLTELSIKVQSVRPEDIQILGMLPNLLFLRLKADHQNYIEQPLQKFTVSPDAFPRVRSCRFYNVIMVPSMFTRGALPRVEAIEFELRSRDFFSNHAQDGFEFDDLAMDHLPLLQKVFYTIYTYPPNTTKEEEVEKLKEAVEHAAEEHPNHPHLYLELS